MQYLVLFIFLLFPPAQGQNADPDFLEGVKAYQDKDFQQAREVFRPLLDQHPENPTVLYNLGLTEYHLGNFGLALGLWRKARILDQSFTDIDQAIQFTEEKLFPNKQSSPFFLSIYNWLKNLPLNFWIALSFISFIAGGWWSLEYGVKRRLPWGEWPTWIYFSLPAFIFSAFFAVSLVLDNLQLKATVIEKNLLTHANPSDSSPTLLELSEGEVVTIEKSHGTWVQVRSQDGAPGWVPQSTLIAFRGK